MKAKLTVSKNMKKALATFMSIVLFAFPCSDSFAEESFHSSSFFHENNGANNALRMTHLQYDRMAVESAHRVDLNSKRIQQKANVCLSKLSIDELNSLITDIKDDSYSRLQKTDNSVYTYSVAGDSTRLAWLAAAEIAKKKGYVCAATLIEYSLAGIDFYESAGFGSGLFKDKIIQVSSFKNYMNRNYSAPTTYTDGLSFEPSDNKDLYYAIHNYKLSTIKEAGSQYVIIQDYYDFDPNGLSYKSLFTDLLVDYAWLCTKTGILNEINVTIGFYY